MAFIVGAVIGAGAALVGGAMSASGQRDAARTAAAGSEREIEFQRESRDLARADQAPYREACTTAISALMSMTGLGGTGGGKATTNWNGPTGALRGRYGEDTPMSGGVPIGGGRRSSYRQVQAKYSGGPIGGQNLYNINEMGPENVYSGGAISRNPNPMTIDGQTGYVQPNIQGRAYGGYMEPQESPPMVSGGFSSNGGTATYGGTAPPPPPPGGAVNPGIANGGVMENPGGQEGGYNFMTDPGYNFRFNEGMRGLERGAAARGGLLSGGFGKKAIRYGQDYASNEYSNVYNRISNIAGLGQVGTNQSGQYAMMAGQGMGNSASNAANASAYGQIGAGNAWANAGNQIAQLPWGQVFNQGPGVSGGAKS